MEGLSELKLNILGITHNILENVIPQLNNWIKESSTHPLAKIQGVVGKSHNNCKRLKDKTRKVAVASGFCANLAT